MTRPYSPMLLRPPGCSGLVRVNWPCRELLGYSAEDLRAQPLLAWIHEQDRAALEAAIQACTSGCGEGQTTKNPSLGPRRTSVPARHCTKDGDWVELQWQFRMHEGECIAHGQVVGASVPLDTSVPTTATASLAQTLEAMAGIVESKNPGMLCSILLVDERCERIVGGAGPSLPDAYNKGVEGLRIGPSVGSCGTAVFWNMPVVVEDIANDPLWRDLGRAASTANVAACWSHPIVGSDGRVLGAMALYDREPRAPERHQMDALAIAAKMVGLAVERDRLAEQLRRTEKMEALGLLAGGVAHDFNNLLAVILGNCELALTRVSDDVDLTEMLRDVLAAGKSAAELCGQVLAFAGRAQSRRELVACNALVTTVGSLLRSVTGGGTHIDYSMCEGECSVLGDAAQLQSLIVNLITNACEAIGDREGRVLVSTRVRHLTPRELAALKDGRTLQADSAMAVGPSSLADEFVEIEVLDSGEGIDDTTQLRMFDPFFSTKSAQRGLGLAAAQGVVASHHGVMTVVSEVGVGTTFTVLLPHAGLVVEPRANVSQSVVPKGLRMLVADDDARVREAVARTLRDVGVHVELAVDGRDAVAVFERHRESMDCVLLDFRMPRMNGGEALREIRRIAPDMPVLLMSGYADCRPMQMLREHGVLSVLQKPMSRRVLIEAICAAFWQVDGGLRSGGDGQSSVVTGGADA